MNLRHPIAALAASILALAAVAGCRGGEEPAAEAAAEPPSEAAGAAEPALPEGDGDLRARILRSTGIHERPGGREVARVGPRTEWGSPSVLAVEAVRGGWLGVLTHERPNGRLGWIEASEARLERVRWAVRASISGRRIHALRDGEVVRTIRAGVGRPDAPTPTGTFAVTDRLAVVGDAKKSYGCCAVALSGRQPMLPEGWRGGDRLAIHGTRSPSSVGGAASFGCFRVGDADLRWLMRRIPLGTRVEISS